MSDGGDESEVRLVDGLNIYEGRVEIYHYSKWGTVCDDDWNLADATVVCRQLGYHHAIEAHEGAYFGGGAADQPIFLDNVRCTGFEADLSSCGHRGWGIHDCDHSQDAGVVCSREGTLRLLYKKRLN